MLYPSSSSFNRLKKKLSGLLAEYLGWESIFYVFGGLGVAWCVAWWWVVRDSPEEDRKITDEELEYLRTAIGVSTQESLMTPPWKKMLTSRPVWAIIIAHFAENWGFYTLLTGLPMFMRGKKCGPTFISNKQVNNHSGIYMLQLLVMMTLLFSPSSSDVLKYKLDQAGFLAAFPYLLMACIVQSAGVLADLARTRGRLSTTQVRKLFTCGSYLCQTIFMSLTALLMFRGAAITCISLSLGCGGFAWAGFSINHLDIAPQ